MMNHSPALPVVSSSIGRTFSLAKMLLAITVLAMWLSLYQIEPALAWLVFVPLSFALLRTRITIIAAQVTMLHFICSTWPRRSNVLDEQIY